MKLCFSTLGCPDWSFSDIIATACDMGYDGVEIRGVLREIDATQIPQFLPKNVGATKALLEKKNLTVACITSACYMNDKNQGKDMLHQAKSYVDTANDMGIKYIRLLADYGPEKSGEQDVCFIAAQIKEVAKYAVEKNVDILIETNGYFANSKKMLELTEAVGEKNVGVLWDIHHPYRYYKETPEYTIETIGDLIRHVHIKDSIIKDGVLKYTMVGYGDLPVKECVKALNDIGYEGYYSLEWLKRWDLSLEEPGIAFASYSNYMNSL